MRLQEVPRGVGGEVGAGDAVDQHADSSQGFGTDPGGLGRRIATAWGRTEGAQLFRLLMCPHQAAYKRLRNDSPSIRTRRLGSAVSK